MAENKASPQAKDSPSMEEILQTIRGVISGDSGENAAPALDLGANQNAKVEKIVNDPEPEPEDEGDDILELTQVVEASDAASDTYDYAEEEDVLSHIDAALDNEPLDVPTMNEADDESSADPVLEVAPAPDDVDDNYDYNEDDDNMTQMEQSPMTDLSNEEVENAVDDRALDGSEDSLISAATAESSSALLDGLANMKPAAQEASSGAPVLPHQGVNLEQLAMEAMRPYLKEWLDRELPRIVQAAVEKEIRRIAPK